MNPKLIEDYAFGGEKLRLAISGLTRDDMQQFPVPGTWSIQQIVMHLMDSDLIATDRMKRVIAEDNPTLLGYDETKFAGKLFYDEQSVEDAVTIFDLNRQNFAKVLRKLPPETFERTGTHNERGVMTLAYLVESYIHHLDHHVKFIHEKRKLMGKEMW